MHSGKFFGFVLIVTRPAYLAIVNVVPGSLSPELEAGMHLKNRFLPIASTWLTRTLIALVLIASTQLPGPVFAQQDPLPSWNEGSNKAKIIDFVDKVTKEGSEDFVPI